MNPTSRSTASGGAAPPSATCGACARTRQLRQSALTLPTVTTIVCRSSSRIGAALRMSKSLTVYAPDSSRPRDSTVHHGERTRPRTDCDGRFPCGKRFVHSECDRRHVERMAATLRRRPDAQFRLHGRTSVGIRYEVAPPRRLLRSRPTRSATHLNHGPFQSPNGWTAFIL
jgi:hypothetical protein